MLRTATLAIGTALLVILPTHVFADPEPVVADEEVPAGASEILEEVNQRRARHGSHGGM
jgi:hypothetical protein